MGIEQMSEGDQQIVADIMKAVSKADSNGLLSQLPRDNLPILYVDEHALVRDEVIRALRAADLPMIVCATLGEAQDELRSRGLTDREIQAKLTGITHSMRSDVELPSLAEVECAMPVFKVNNPGKSSQRPALPKNRKRDRWN